MVYDLVSFNLLSFYVCIFYQIGIALPNISNLLYNKLTIKDLAKSLVLIIWHYLSLNFAAHVFAHLNFLCLICYGLHN